MLIRILMSITFLATLCSCKSDSNSTARLTPPLVAELPPSNNAPRLATEPSPIESESESTQQPTNQLPLPKTTEDNKTIATYRFVDSPVEGLFYSTSSGLSGFTNSEGQFEANDGDVITFYLGNENGLKLGAASLQKVITPFEITGKYTRALSVAILLQSLDKEFGSTTDEQLSIPNHLQSTPASNIAIALAQLRLDNMDSVRTFLISIGVKSHNVVNEFEAVEHLYNSLNKIERGDTNAINPLSGNELLYVKHIKATNSYMLQNRFYEFVHIDKILDGQTLDVMDSAVFYDYKIHDNDVIQLRSSKYNIVQLPSYLPQGFTHLLLSNKPSSNVDKRFSRNGFHGGVFSSSYQNTLNHFAVSTLPFDSLGHWQHSLISRSYDPATQIVTEINNAAILQGNECNRVACSQKNTHQQVNYYYQIDHSTADRYIDFSGTWQDTRICENGTIAKRKLHFDESQLTITGETCMQGTTKNIENSQIYSYEELQRSEFWWFNKPNRHTKATLSELNSTLRFDGGVAHQASTYCENPNVAFVKWEYHPAGINWDQGVLNRVKMHCDGTLNLHSVMQKLTH